MSNNKWLRFGGALAALVAFQATAHAEDASVPKSKPDSASAASSSAAPAGKTAESDFEVVITAQKRQESLQTVPLAVSAFTDKMREKIGIVTVQDITNFTPGLSYSAALDRIYLRGIGRSTNNLASDGGTATYSDGVYTSSTTSAGTPQIFIDRVEVLRGPQGTLYGRNSIGGAINVISRHPSNTFDVDLRGQAGNFGRYEVGGRVSGPLSDQIRYSFTGDWAKQDEGYFRNVNGNKSEGGNGDTGIFEAQLAADLTSDLSAWMRIRSATWDQSYRSGNSRGDYDFALVPAGSLGPGAAWALVPGNALSGSVITNGAFNGHNPGIADVRAFSGDTYAHSTLDKNVDFAGEISWKLPDFDIKYIGGAQTYFYHLQTDFDGTNVAQYTVPLTGDPTCLSGFCAVVHPQSVFNYIEDKRWFSHEVNISSKGQGPFQWIGGLYVYQEDFHQPVYFPVVNTPAINNPRLFVPPASVVAAAPNPKGWIYYIDQRTESRSQAAFGQIDWAFADHWKFTGGLRYTHDEKDGTEYTRQLCYAGAGGPALAFLCPSLQTAGVFSTAGDITTFLISHAPTRGAGIATVRPATGIWSRPFGASWNATTGTAGVEWTPISDTLFYAKYSRGYKAGGFNSGTISAGIETDPEHVNAYEIGAKTRPFASLQANASAFYYDYLGRQTPLTVVPTSGPSFTSFVNVPKSESVGFELETIWTPLTDLQILFNYAYLDATVKDGCCYIDGVDPLATQPGAHEVVQAGPDGILGTLDDIHGGQSVGGQQLPLSPKNKIAVNANYTFHLDNSGSVNLSASYFWRDVQWSSFFNRSYYRVPAYDQVDLRATWTDPSNSFKVIAFGRNVFDTLGYDNRTGALIRSGAIVVTESVTPPRTFGVELQAKF